MATREYVQGYIQPTAPAQPTQNKQSALQQMAQNQWSKQAPANQLQGRTVLPGKNQNWMVQAPTPTAGGRGSTDGMGRGPQPVQGGGQSGGYAPFQAKGQYAGDIQNYYDMQQQAANPAKQAYENQIKNINSLYDTQRQQLSGQVDPTNKRYDVMLDELRRREGVDANRATNVTNNELARRGIVSNSGVGEREMQGAIAPISEQYTNMYRDTSLQREQDIKDIQNKIQLLFPQQRVDTGNVSTQIANMLYNAGQTGISQGMQQGQFGEQMGLQKDQFSFQKDQAVKEDDFKYKQLEYQKEQDRISNDFARAQFEYNKAKDQRDFVAARAAEQMMNDLKSQQARIDAQQAKLQQEAMQMQNQQSQTMNDFYSKLMGGGGGSSSGRYSLE